MDAVLGCERRVLSASLRRMARFSGPWSLRLRARSSSKTTSRTQCSWFSIPQWARVIASTRAGDHRLDSKKYRTIGGSSASPTRRCSSIRASALIPGKSCLRASPAAGTTTAWRRSSRPWLPVRGCCTCGCSASGSSSICASVNSADWLALSAKAYCPPRWRMHWANSAWQCSASAVTVQPSSASSSKASNAAATSLRLGANRWAIASRASAAHTLTSCSGVVLRPRSNAPRKALPSTATTPCSSLANSARNRRNTGSNACGSSSLNIRLKVSWLGMPCSSRRNWRNRASLAQPNSAMSAQLSAPHSTAANAMTKTSTKSCRALSARGSGTSWKRFLNFCIGRPPHSDSGVVFRIHIARQRNTATMAKCDSPARKRGRGAHRVCGAILHRRLEQRIGASASLERARCGGEPRARFALDERRQGIAHPGVIAVEPGGFLGRETLAGDQPAVDRRQCERLERIERFFRAGDRRGANHQQQILDADTIGAAFVIAGLIRQDHAGLERGGAELGNVGGAFVHREIAAHAVPSAVVEVEALRPQELSRKRVELRAGGSLGKECARDGDMALEHVGEAVAHLGGRLANDNGAGGGRGARPLFRARREPKQRT